MTEKTKEFHPAIVGLYERRKNITQMWHSANVNEVIDYAEQKGREDTENKYKDFITKFAIEFRISIPSEINNNEKALLWILSMHNLQGMADEQKRICKEFYKWVTEVNGAWDKDYSGNRRQMFLSNNAIRNMREKIKGEKI